ASAYRTGWPCAACSKRWRQPFRRIRRRCRSRSPEYSSPADSGPTMSAPAPVLARTEELEDPLQRHRHPFGSILATVDQLPERLLQEEQLEERQQLSRRSRKEGRAASRFSVRLQEGSPGAC